MAFPVILENGLSEKQSIGDVYEVEDPSEEPSESHQPRVSCRQTGRGFTQEDKHQIFLVPA